MNKIQINSIIEQLCNDIAVITSNKLDKIDSKASLASLGIDSLSLVEIFIAVEHKYGIKLLEANLNNDDLISIEALSNKVLSLITK